MFKGQARERIPIKAFLKTNYCIGGKREKASGVRVTKRGENFNK